MGLKVVFAQPTYQPIAPRVHIAQLNAVMYAANKGTEWVAIPDIPEVKLATIDNVRNLIVRNSIKLAEELHVDGLVWLDSDIKTKPDGLYRLLDNAAQGHDFVTGMYRHKTANGEPIVGIIDPKQRNGIGSVMWLQEWDANTVYPVDACGFGCVYTSLRMLRLMGDPWFSFGDWSEDFTFCIKAKQAGFQLYCDTAITCIHVGEPQEWTIEEFQERRAKTARRDAAPAA